MYDYPLKQAILDGIVKQPLNKQEFGGDRLLVVHPDNKGEVSKT